MNTEALYISFFTAIAMVMLIKGIKQYFHKDIEINKFMSNYSKEPEKVIKDRTLSYSKTIVIITAGGLSIGVLAYAVIGSLYLAGFFSLLGFLFPKLWYKWHANNQDKLISKQMEKAAETMAAVLKTENNIVAALERAALDCEDPLKPKLIKAAQEIRLGIQMNIAFDTLAKSVNVPEMMIISIGIELQQQGMAINMASMLDQVQKNIRNREALKDELSVMTTENKMAGWIVAVIPLATLAMIRQADPEFVAPLFNTTVGLSVFTLCVSTIAAGLYWLLQIAEMKEF